MEMINYICMLAFTVPDSNGRKKVEAEIEVKFRPRAKCAKVTDRCKQDKKEI